MMTDAAPASPALPARSILVHDALRAAGIAGEIVVLPDAASTAVLAAEALGVEVGAIANSLVFWSDDEPLLVMTSGAHRVDTTALATRLGRGRIARATPDQVREATGQAIGGVAPTGHPAPLTTIVDEDLAAYPEIWAAGGTPHTVFPLTYSELVRLTGGRVSKVD
jgi:prolyl-tRNA editing enzyme YbaK/EbsC (Cys-tRNA(Pro) deacylase)